MAVSMSTKVRNRRAQVLIDAAGDNARIQLFDGVRPPADGSMVGRLLAELVCESPIAAGPVDGRVVFAPVSPGVAFADGTVGWVRVVSADDETVFVGSVPADVQVRPPQVRVSQPVMVELLVLTEGNR